MKNHYEILGVSPNASTEEIQKAYRKLSKKLHPDQNNNDPYFNDMFKRINEAYGVLTNPSKRIEYDKNLATNSLDYELNLDPLVVDAGILVLKENQANLGLIQRKLRTGYNRAGRLIDQLEYLGIVSGFESGKERRILVSKAGLEAILTQNIEGLSKLDLREKFDLEKSSTSKPSDDKNYKAKKTTSVWDNVKKWRKIKWSLLIIDVGLLVILLSSPNSPQNLKQYSSTKPAYANAKITTDNGLHVRAEPDSKATILTTIPGNGYLKILKTNGPDQRISGRTANWYKVKHKGKTGWAWGGFIKRIK